VAKTEVAEASEAKVEKAQPQDTKVQTVKAARKQDGPAAALAVKALSNAAGQPASSRASSRNEPADGQPDRLPRRWAPILVAAIVMVAAAGAVWWLGGP
jgi:ferric-dicitrate binding protein FerR (iron transport regulator)